MEQLYILILLSPLDARKHTPSNRSRYKSYLSRFRGHLYNDEWFILKAEEVTNKKEVYHIRGLRDHWWLYVYGKEQKLTFHLIIDLYNTSSIVLTSNTPIKMKRVIRRSGNRSGYFKSDTRPSRNYPPNGGNFEWNIVSLYLIMKVLHVNRR